MPKNLNTLKLPAGTTTIPPMMMATGVLNTTPQTGALEFDGTHYYVVIAGVRYQLDQQTTLLYIPRLIYKATDESVNNSAVFQDDNDFTFSAAAYSKYHVKATLNVYQASSSSDFKFKFVVPTGFVFKGNYKVTPEAYVEEIESHIFNDLTTEKDIEMNSGVPSTYWNIELDGIVDGALIATGGTVKLQWAQYNAVVANTTVKQYSSMIIHKY